MYHISRSLKSLTLNYYNLVLQYYSPYMRNNTLKGVLLQKNHQRQGGVIQVAMQQSYCYNAKLDYFPPTEHTKGFYSLYRAAVINKHHHSFYRFIDTYNVVERLQEEIIPVVTSMTAAANNCSLINFSFSRSLSELVRKKTLMLLKKRSILKTLKCWRLLP